MNATSSNSLSHKASKADFTKYCPTTPVAELQSTSIEHFSSPQPNIKMGSTTPLPYWQINIFPEKREAQCPPFLASLNAKDRGIISTPDEHYQLLTWPEVQNIIVKNRIDLFQRLPSDLRRYLQYNSYLKQEYGSVMNFVLKERLQWSEPVTPKGQPFEDETDVKILWNDWPYGLDKRIVHLVVWTKFELVDDEETGDLTLEARRQVDDYVDENFGRVVGKENVIWFKNWKILKSIHAVEHFHVMLFNPDMDFIKKVTNGDIPLSQKV